MVSTEYTSVLVPRKANLALEEIKAHAEAHQRDLKDVLASIEVPDISAELNDISLKLASFRNRLAETLDAVHYPEIQATIQRLTNEAAEHQAQIKHAVNALGYPNLVDDYEKAKAARDAYRGLVMAAINDMTFLAQTHASDYAIRRTGELKKKLAEIEK